MIFNPSMCAIEGSISGQLAGSFYGFSSIRKQLVHNALRWDRAENMLRAVMITPWFQGRTSSSSVPSSSPSAELEEKISDGQPEMGSSTSSISGKFARVFSSIARYFFPSQAIVVAKNESNEAAVEAARMDLLKASAAGDLPAFRSSFLILRSQFVSSLEDVLWSLDGDDSTCLHLSAGNGHVDVVQHILSIASQEQTDAASLPWLDHRNSNGHTAILLALANGHEDIVSALLTAGASLSGSVGRGRNAAYLMARHGMLRAITAAIELRGIETVKQLAAETDSNGYNSLHAAILLGQKDMIDLLLDKVGLSMSCAAKDGSTCLHVAARSKVDHLSEKEVKEFHELLVTHCPSDILSSQDSFGMTPLHAAGFFQSVAFKLKYSFLFSFLF